jgi:RNA polymerase sigma factor (sigma-70 family)
MDSPLEEIHALPHRRFALATGLPLDARRRTTKYSMGLRAGTPWRIAVSRSRHCLLASNLSQLSLLTGSYNKRSNHPSLEVMGEPVGTIWMAEQDQRITAAIAQEHGRLRNFIRKRVADDSDVEDILQDVFYELVAASRLMKPIEEVSAWMFRVARNRIIDRFRKKRPAASISDSLVTEDQGEGSLLLEDLLPSPDAGPDAAYARGVLFDELDAALDELPEEQREVFVAHELEGRSFKELAEETGLGVNTLLARKHYAVLHLRKRLRAIHDEFLHE